MNRVCKSKLAVIKAEIDSRLFTLYQALSSIPVVAKEDQMCQTQSNGSSSVQQLHKLQQTGFQEFSNQRARQKSINSTEMQSLPNLSTSEIRQNTLVKVRIKESYKKSSSRECSKGIKHASTSVKRQKLKSKIDNGNQVFQSILKQRKKSVPIKRLFSMSRERQLKNQTLLKYSTEIRSIYKNDRQQSDDGYVARRKLMDKIENLTGGDF